MNITIFYHDAAKGFGRMPYVGELQDAKEYFERICDLSRVTYCGAVLTQAL